METVGVLLGLIDTRTSCFMVLTPKETTLNRGSPDDSSQLPTLFGRVAISADPVAPCRWFLERPGCLRR